MNNGTNIEEMRAIAAEILSLLKTKHLTVAEAKDTLQIVKARIEQIPLK